RAVKGLEAEIFVVDNNSVDGSVAMVKEKFPSVTLIENKENTGFSKANNQAMRVAQGEYMLLLNPDTVVEDDTFSKVIRFMDQHPDAGGLGVRMVDGKGKFLPESKRGLPTPATAFYKISGISKLFPGSARFNRYYLGNLDPDKTHEIEILSGAFMLMRKTALDKVGLLDEDFFMYGEDIDLSWRIIQGGWKNYYYPDTRIIHYKGESTKKGSLNYVFVFYNAMVIFARKHFSASQSRWFGGIIHMAIWLRAGLAVVRRFLSAIWLPTLDAAFTLGLLWLVKDQYAHWQHKIYDPVLVRTAFVACAISWLFGVWLAGGYDKPVRPQKVVRPILITSAVLLMTYSLLPEDLRFSRALVLTGMVIALAVFFINRVVINYVRTRSAGLRLSKGIAGIAGAPDEISRVKQLLHQSGADLGEVVSISPADVLHNLGDIVRVHNLDQVVFCARDISASDIISSMSSVDVRGIDFKIAPPESAFVIGSGSIETPGDVLLDVNSISLPRNRRLKRLVDISICMISLPLLPILIFVVKRPFGLLQNLWSVALGRRTWVGYAPMSAHDKSYKLPSLKPCVLPLNFTSPHLTADQTQRINLVYARDYKPMRDVQFVLKGVRGLGG
ncbi:MAG: glycosyltransferase, partial [Flavobacteriales bacterium]|nr:glycosyltransferase [Flavobacteriales bacterium]